MSVAGFSRSFGLHARIAPRFARAEPRRRVLAYLQGILSDIVAQKRLAIGRTRPRSASRWHAALALTRGLGYERRAR